MDTRTNRGIWCILLALGMLAGAMIACDGCQGQIVPPATVEPAETPIPDDALGFQVRRETTAVMAGPQDLLPELTDSAFHALDLGDWVTTDRSGEALLQSQIGGGACQVYIFYDTQLRKSACRKSASTAGNTVCQEQGAAVYRDCGNRLKWIETPSATFQVIGSWVEVIYLPERRLTLALVFDGEAAAVPVIDFDARTLGQGVRVPRGYFWFTDPGLSSGAVAGLAGRTPHRFEDLPPVIDALGIAGWVGRTRDHAEGDRVAFPDWMTCAPGVLYCENFEDRKAAWWELQPGWEIVAEEGGYALRGEGYRWATLTEHAWGSVRARFRLKLMEGEIHLVYRHSDAGRGPIRYFVRFGADGSSLHKQVENRFEDLQAAEVPHRLDRWYEIEITGWEGRLQVRVDGGLELDYVDLKPLTSGTIAFETQDDSFAFLDDIEILPAGSPPIGPQITATPTTRPPTSRPTYTLTPRPSSTPTSRPTLTRTPRPTLTHTPRPTQTFTPSPTPTPRPTVTPYVSCAPAQVSIELGNSTTLSWNVRNVRAVALDNETVAFTGERRVTPSQSRVYTLLATTDGGERTCRMSVIVRDTTKPVISDVRTEPASSLPAGRTLPYCGMEEQRLSARVTDLSKQVKVEVRGSSNCEFLQTRTMSAVGGDVFQATIPAGWCYQIRAEDGVGNVTQTALARAPCQPVQILYDFVAQAPKATWYGYPESSTTTPKYVRLPWPGKGTDQMGFARWMDNAILEDGHRATRVLETHPRWLDDGRISGNYSLAGISIQKTDRLVARVGFLEGATAGNAAFMVTCWNGDPDSHDIVVGGVIKKYDRLMRDIDVPIPCSGKYVEFTLIVRANGTSSQDWAVWEVARIERRK